MPFDDPSIVRSTGELHLININGSMVDMGMLMGIVVVGPLSVYVFYCPIEEELEEYFSFLVQYWFLKSSTSTQQWLVFHYKIHFFVLISECTMKIVKMLIQRLEKQ